MPFTVEETTVNLVVNEEAATNIVVTEEVPVYILVQDGLIQGSGAGISWSVVTADTTTENANGYVANSASLVTFTLPSPSYAGDVVRVAGLGTGGWRVGYEAGNYAIFGPKQTTISTGYLDSTHSRDSIELLCIEPNIWQVISSVGNIEVV